jgi:hypothetical protein
MLALHDLPHALFDLFQIFGREIARQNDGSYKAVTLRTFPQLVATFSLPFLRFVCGAKDHRPSAQRELLVGCRFELLREPGGAATNLRVAAE